MPQGPSARVRHRSLGDAGPGRLGGDQDPGTVRRRRQRRPGTDARLRGGLSRRRRHYAVAALRLHARLRRRGRPPLRQRGDAADLPPPDRGREDELLHHPHRTQRRQQHLAIETRAVRDGDVYRINGQKIWISGIQQAQKALIVARTHPAGRGPQEELRHQPLHRRRPLRGPHLPAHRKMGTHTVWSNMVFFDDLRVPADRLIGKENEGWTALLDVLNTERMLCARRLHRHSRHRPAHRRAVCHRSGGSSAGPSVPIRASSSRWPTSRSAPKPPVSSTTRRPGSTTKACPAAPRPTWPSHLAVDVGFFACDQAIQTMGGYGYAVDSDLERLWRDARLYRLAPISQQMTPELRGPGTSWGYPARTRGGADQAAQPDRLRMLVRPSPAPSRTTPLPTERRPVPSRSGHRVTVTLQCVCPLAQRAVGAGGLLRPGHPFPCGRIRSGQPATAECETNAETWNADSGCSLTMVPTGASSTSSSWGPRRPSLTAHSDIAWAETCDPRHIGEVGRPALLLLEQP